MTYKSLLYLTLGATMALAGGGAMAQPDHHDGAPAGAHGGGGGRGGGGGGGGGQRPMGEAHPGPSGYQRVAPPQGWDSRPQTINRSAYQHNYQAARSFHIGAYRAPTANWRARRWAYGQILPRMYWGSQFIIGDYWLFALEVPPVGCEWVRYGDDALLINTTTGEILQVEYGAFG